MTETGIDDPLPSSIIMLLSVLSTELLINIPTILVYGLILLTLLILSGLISGSEVAYFSLTLEDIENCKNSKSPVDNKIHHLIFSPDRLLATILILNNLVNISIVTISTFATWQIVGRQGTEGLVIIALSVFVTAIIVYFGEIVPKVYANQNNMKFARLTSGLLSVASWILYPLAALLLSMSSLVERTVKKRGYDLSKDELHKALEITTEKEATEEEKEILKGIVNFSTLSVKQIMKSRMDITAFDIETDFHELMNQVNKTGFSRIPIFKETIDKIEGILYIKDILPHLNENEGFDWVELLRPAFFVPESKKIDGLFRDFQEKRVHMAIVVDEYGGTSGIVTMEDVIEEIIGEINDEFDEESEIAFNKLDNNTYVFEGKTSLNDFCKITEIDSLEFEAVKGESESLGGLILEINKKLPNSGEKITYKNFVFTVVAVDKRRIKRVRVFITPSSKELVSDFQD